MHSKSTVYLVFKCSFGSIKLPRPMSAKRRDWLNFPLLEVADANYVERFKGFAITAGGPEVKFTSTHPLRVGTNSKSARTAGNRVIKGDGRAASTATEASDMWLFETATVSGE